MTVRKNGILTKAIQVKDDSQSAKEKEETELNELYSKMLVATNDSSQVTISIEDLKTLISNQVKEELKNNSTSENPVGTVISYMENTAPTGYRNQNFSYTSYCIVKRIIVNYKNN